MTGTTANPQFYLIDKDLKGLITKKRSGVDPSVAPFAKAVEEVESIGLQEGSNILEVVKKLKPHALVGLSGVGGIFNEQVLQAMRDSDSPKPAIFPMSNPTNNGLFFRKINFFIDLCVMNETAECTADDAFKHAGENIVFGSGSPFQNVDLGNGKVGHVNQANNMYLFPGIGLGALLSGARIVSNGMLQAASEWYRSQLRRNKHNFTIKFWVSKVVAIKTVSPECVTAGVVKGYDFYALML